MREEVHEGFSAGGDNNVKSLTKGLLLSSGAMAMSNSHI